ncbi:MAG: DUF192 domain-containing protein [Actinomycetota bacterium]
MRSVELFGPRGLRVTAHVPSSRRDRVRGLRGHHAAEAMLFEHCRSVHTIGMRVPITVAGLDREWRVRRVTVVRPRRLVLPRVGVRHILELDADADVRPGDRLEIVMPAIGRARSSFRSTRRR